MQSRTPVLEVRMPDPYQTLGVTKSASADELKSAYRKLAKKLHPDVNPGRKDIEQKFKEVTAAYDLLSDPAKRARYDRGEIDGMGNERGYSRAGADPFGGAQGRSRSYAGGGHPFSGMGADDFFAEFFGAQGQARRNAGSHRAPERGQDITYKLSIPFVEACLGERKRVTLSDHKTVDVNIPPGTEDGHKLRLRGLGSPGGTQPGDAIIELQVEPHPHFVRKDDEIHLEVPISLPEAIGGASIKVPTLSGHVSVKVPKGANSGTVLRLKGKGIPKPHGEHGDMFVKLKIMLPEPLPDDLVNVIEKWAKKNAYNPRAKLGWL